MPVYFISILYLVAKFGRYFALVRYVGNCVLYDSDMYF